MALVTLVNYDRIHIPFSGKFQLQKAIPPNSLKQLLPLQFKTIGTKVLSPREK